MTKIHDTVTELPELCKESFLTKDRAQHLIFVLIGILIAYGGTAVAWALQTNTQITKLQSEQVIQANHIQYLSEQINNKLDILIGDKK
jgi:hypothetical protein